MNDLLRRSGAAAFAAFACLGHFPVWGATCAPKEYAQYKDEAKTRSGQMSMASEYCLASIRQKSAAELAALALKHSQMRDAMDANADASACLNQMTKISDALRAAKASAAMKYIVAECKGPIPK